MIKTIIRHYQELDIEIRKKAVANTIKQRGITHLLTIAAYPSDAINRGMKWQHTPEGHEYWKDIYTKLKEDGN